ncbi:MAG TPA: Lrp/AsnC family transcriptional regulator [Kineosporiaceae bacterium]|nr:Lrp/AsnC family transcriptional regulator [Kineosporiaceae bacterium]
MVESARTDPVDHEILRLLQLDARISNRELAAAVGVAPSTCSDRVNRLRAIGVIQGYTVRVEASALGRPLEAMLAVRVQPHRRPLVTPFVAHVLALPETRALYHLTGPDDFMVHVATPSVADLQRLVLDELTARPEVALVHTNLIFQQWPGHPLLPPDAPAAEPRQGR